MWHTANRLGSHTLLKYFNHISYTNLFTVSSRADSWSTISIISYWLPYIWTINIIRILCNIWFIVACWTTITNLSTFMVMSLELVILKLTKSMNFMCLVCIIRYKRSIKLPIRIITQFIKTVSLKNVTIY